MTLVVLFGGRSDERHVSVASAQNIARTLENALLWFWAPDGRIHDVGLPELLAHQQPFTADFVPSRPAVWPDLEQALDTLPVEDPIFVLGLHGGEGEDGTVQRMLEARRVPFTGSGSAASHAAFDKARAKELLTGRVLLAESLVARPAEIARTTREMLSRHERVVLKPRAGGSSRGLFFVGRDEDADAAATEAAGLGIDYVVEEYLGGRELTDGVAEIAGKLEALPVLEVVMETDRTFDYEGKYLGHGSREICPAEIPDALRDEVQHVALVAHEVLGCSGYSRTDVVATGRGVCYLETNTLPGLTARSLVPQELAARGITMRTFLEQQIELARTRL